jgi:hypothetical protein
LEHEVRRKATGIAAHGKVQVLGEHSIQLGQIGVQHDVFSSNDVKPGGYVFDADSFGCGG